MYGSRSIFMFFVTSYLQMILTYSYEFFTSVNTTNKDISTAGIGLDNNYSHRVMMKSKTFNIIWKFIGSNTLWFILCNNFFYQIICYTVYWEAFFMEQYCDILFHRTQLKKSLIACLQKIHWLSKSQINLGPEFGLNWCEYHCLDFTFFLPLVLQFFLKLVLLYYYRSCDSKFQNIWRK